jgi:uncharacterized protein (TIGR02284 family)
VEIEKMSTATTDKSVNVLNELIAICEDGAKGFAKASEDVEESSLKELFSRYASQRAAYSAELKQEVELLGETPSHSGHAMAVFHRAWISLKEAVGNKDQAIVDEYEAGEDSALKAYREALLQPLPPAASQIVTRQLVGVLEAHGKISALKHIRN